MMTRIKLLYFIITALLCFNACNDPCDDVNCLNGGICVEGTCDCPEGYAGANCEITPCDQIECLNGADCTDGTCICPDGYTGTNCELETREAFIGNWTGLLACEGEQDEVELSILADPSSITSVIIDLDGGIFNGFIIDEMNLEITEQRITVSGDDFIVEGSITINDDGSMTMPITIIFVEDNESVSCIITATK